MKNTLCAIQVFPVIVSLIFFTACKGQENKQAPSNNVNTSKPITSELPKLIKQQGTYSYMTHTGPHSDTLVSISAILEDTKGNIWATTTGEGVYCYNGEKFINLTEKEGLLTNDVYSIIEDKAGNLWLGTTNGVSRYDGKSFTNYPFSVIKNNTSAIGLETNAPNLHTEVWSILQDKEGNIWLGTTNGVYSYNGSTFTNILALGILTTPLKPDVSDIRAVTDIIQDKEGNIWFTSWTEGLCRFDGKHITSFKNEGLSNNDRLIQDRSGTIWIGKRGNGVCRYDGKTFENLFSDKAITDMKEDGKGNIWLATFDRKNNSGSIICYNPFTNQIMEQFTIQEKTGTRAVSCIALDKSGHVWFGSDKMTLSKYDGTTFTIFLSE